MLRTIAISLMLLLTVGVMLPFANSAHGVRQSSQVNVRKSQRYHSRAWWKRYRARLRKKRAAAAAALAHRKAVLGQPQNISLGDSALSALPTVPTVTTTEVAAQPANAPAATLNNMDLATPTVAAAPAVTTPSGVSTTSTPATTVNSKPTAAKLKNSEVKTPVKSVAPILPGQMNLSVVAMSRPNPAFLTSREEAKMVGGTSVSELRRIVIDKMIVSGGWVTNDFVKEVNGSKVFVVTARTPKDASSPEKSWTFYFTEADGRIYGLTTDAPVNSADRMSNEAERFINKLHSNSQPNNR
jgi:hypothetical protein